LNLEKLPCPHTRVDKGKNGVSMVQLPPLFQDLGHADLFFNSDKTVTPPIFLASHQHRLPCAIPAILSGLENDRKAG